MARLSQKYAGAYYTPDDVAACLARWAVGSGSDRMLDPSCGDGSFIVQHRNSVGIEQDPVSARQAVERAPWALVHEGDFFQWAAQTKERFECAAGNPPFIRYQTFKGEVRERAVALCNRLGASFSGLASAWAPFLVATAGVLKPGGRMAFVVPAEIGHAPYAAPLLDYLVDHFARVQIVAVRDKLFPTLSEDCWLLYVEGFGGRATTIGFSAVKTFKPSVRPPKPAEEIPVGEWRTVWNRRLRPFLVSGSVRDLYRIAADHPDSERFSDLASVGIGYVSGANEFFHLRPSQASRLNIPGRFLHPTVRNGRALPNGAVTEATVRGWKAADDAVLLLKLQRADELPTSVKRYLDSAAGKAAREGYKCRNRAPWYAVPDVQVPDLILSYMSGFTPNLVKNTAGCTCTNSVHSVRLKPKADAGRILKAWSSPFVKLSAELEGHALGGGMLKLEPREAGRILFPAADAVAPIRNDDVESALSVLRSWRHYDA
ncbi:MAG: N-6 DNA methylase [Caulobacteraceae bacterium]|nr:N-6 DNA methylase [Caulobacteraceae bacterium]